MNPEKIIQMLNELPDEMIDSANQSRFRHRKKFWCIIPTIAACFVGLIAVTVYHKMQVQTPEITESPMTAMETTSPMMPITESFVTSDTHTIHTETQMTGTQTAKEQTTVVRTVTACTTAVTVPIETSPSITDAPAVIEPMQTELPVVTEPPAESTDPIVAVTTEPQPITLPVWQGITGYPESVSMPYIDCRFGLCPNDVNDRMRIEYGITPEYDLMQHQCLLIDVESGYSMAAVIGGKLTPEGLSLKVIYLNRSSDLAVHHYAIPLPENYTLDPENCYAECTELTDETEFQAMLTEIPMIELIE